MSERKRRETESQRDRGTARQESERQVEILLRHLHSEEQCMCSLDVRPAESASAATLHLRASSRFCFGTFCPVRVSRLLPCPTARISWLRVTRMVLPWRVNVWRGAAGEKKSRAAVTLRRAAEAAGETKSCE